jgi:fatty-acyl-CoA synthase
MHGLMMETQLSVQLILERAKQFFPKKEIITRSAEGVHRYTYGDFYKRVLQLASLLQKMGIKAGDRVATFAWNNFRHLELYFAIPCVGAVLHTVNIRLAADQIAYIVNHAEDQILFFDSCLAPLVKQFAPELKTVKHFVVMDENAIEELKAESYEKLISTEPDDFVLPKIEDENMAAGLCYTSGTTGNPKGVLYSHRSIYLHSMAVCMADMMGLCEKDTIFPVVPMFHANAWGFPFAGTMVGATQVFPNHFMQPRDIISLIEQEKVTITAGVPTIWLGIMAILDHEKFNLENLRLIVIGGSAVPASMIEYFQNKYDIPVMQAWGMTETSPLGSVARVKSNLMSLSNEDQMTYRTKQGVPAACVQIRALDDDGKEVVWDGETRGELQVRGPWVAKSYFQTEERKEAFSDGWFSTGDVVTIDSEGYIAIVDRTKDLIKSGGEWISSVDLENALLGYPKIQEAAVVAVPHEKWVERPLACIVPKPAFAEDFNKEEVLDYLRGKFASWWIPNAVEIIKEIPKTSVGKFDKKRLRVIYQDYKWPENNEN